jgi:hypothetical protein
LQRRDHGWRRRREIDHVELVIRYCLQIVAVLGDVDRVCDQRKFVVRRDREVGRWPNDRIFER